ncbi:hypothetical protein ACFLSV_07720 [Bacteroidota bacterium]
MKSVILLISIFLFIGCSLSSHEQVVNIKIKPSDVGYDVYAEDGELLLEFTDKDELDLLRKISVASKDQSVELMPIKDGYSVSAQNGELIIEFIVMETNKEESELLKYIYEVALDYRAELMEKFE